MEKKFRLLFLLALLMTAATGAWAQDAKHLITATYREQTRSLEQPLPYATTIGEFYEAVTGQSFSDLISSMSSVGMPLTGITSRNTSVVSIGELNGASTPVTVNADGETIINLIFGSYVQGIFVSAISPLYAYMKDGVKDADKWTASTDGTNFGALPIGGLKGDGSETVTLQYTGRLKVKGVTATSDAAPAAPTGKTVDLATLTADYEAQNGDVLTGTLGANVKISIADGATVTLDNVTINGVNDGNYEWAGITCLGDATIILSGTNTVKGFYEDYPGIQAAADKTLIINGTGSLTASNYGYAAAIGGGNKVACGNIEIQGGTITATTGGRVAGIGGGHNASCGNITISGGTVTATGGTNGAGIGGGYNASWGNITISGGTVNATGGEYGAGIGGGKRGAASFSCGNIIISGGTVTATGGENAPGIGGGRGNNNKTLSSCGDITIANTVTKVTATKGENAPNSIGAGYWGNCGTVTIGGTKYWENNAAVNGGDTYLAQSPLIYDPAAPAEEPVTLATPLTIEAITAGTIQVNINGTLDKGMKYSVNGGTKTPITSTTTIEGLKAGDKVQFYSNGTGNTAYSDDPEVNISGGTAEVKAYGNIMSLLDEEGFATKTKLQNYAF